MFFCHFFSSMYFKSKSKPIPCNYIKSNQRDNLLRIGINFLFRKVNKSSKLFDRLHQKEFDLFVVELIFTLLYWQSLFAVRVCFINVVVVNYLKWFYSVIQSGKRTSPKLNLKKTNIFLLMKELQEDWNLTWVTPTINNDIKYILLKDSVSYEKGNRISSVCVIKRSFRSFCFLF